MGNTPTKWFLKERKKNAIKEWISSEDFNIHKKNDNKIEVINISSTISITVVS